MKLILAWLLKYWLDRAVRHLLEDALLAHLLQQLLGTIVFAGVLLGLLEGLLEVAGLLFRLREHCLLVLLVLLIHVDLLLGPPTFAARTQALIGIAMGL